MATHRLKVADLAARLVNDAEVSYNTDTADELVLNLTVEGYATLLPVQPWDRVELTAQLAGVETLVFSGVVPLSGGITEGAKGQSTVVRALSDFHVLEQTVYAKISNGAAMMPSAPETVSLSAYAAELFAWASGWDGSVIASTLSVEDGLGTVLCPVSSGTTTCAGLLSQAMDWQPGAVLTQRYSPTQVLRLGMVDESDVLTLDAKEDKLTDVRMQPRADLVPPVCALVGGAHLVLPEGADVRTPGAYVVAVPAQPNSWLGGRKETVRGLLIPTRSEYTARFGKQMQPESIDATTKAFILAFWPEYAGLIDKLDADVCYVSTLPVENLQWPGSELDPDADGAPTNYDTDLQAWSQLAPNVCVHTAGSFPASATRSKNVSGLKWCRAELNMNVSISASVEAEMTKEERLMVQALLPGIIPKGTSGTSGTGRQGRYAQLTLSCNLINTKQRIFDTSTNELLAGDVDYTAPDESSSVRVQSYVDAMTAYYNQSRDVWTQGSVTLIHDGVRNPAEMTGRCLQIYGLNEAWASMKALVRSVVWDLSEGTVSLDVGPRGLSEFGELLEIQEAGRRTTRFMQRRGLGVDTLDTDALLESEANMVVGADISASQSVERGGTWRKPFSIWLDEENTAWLEGGRITRGNRVLEIPTTKHHIVDGAEVAGTVWALGLPVKAKAYKMNGELTYSVYQ